MENKSINKLEIRTRKLEHLPVTQKELYHKIRESGREILQSANFESSREYVQHGTMSVRRHCIDVARCSLAITRILKIPCNEQELIRGALLHDYFLYDWHDKTDSNNKRLHGFFHPRIALRNAGKEYRLTAREKDIIVKHMWPLTVLPPLYREAWVVTMADKYCSLLETIRLRKEHIAGEGSIWKI